MNENETKTYTELLKGEIAKCDSKIEEAARSQAQWVHIRNGLLTARDHFLHLTKGGV